MKKLGRLLSFFDNFSSFQAVKTANVPFSAIRAHGGSVEFWPWDTQSEGILKAIFQKWWVRVWSISLGMNFLIDDKRSQGLLCVTGVVTEVLKKVLKNFSLSKSQTMQILELFSRSIRVRNWRLTSLKNSNFFRSFSFTKVLCKTGNTSLFTSLHTKTNRLCSTSCQQKDLIFT